MRIHFLSDNFPPETNAPANRTYDHVRRWVEAGHDVTVVTGVPNFPRGKVFDGYRNRPYQRETMDGIDVVRVWTYIAPNEGFVRRTLDYVSFMVGATVASLAGPKPDVVIATSPQFFTALAGIAVGALRRTPWVLEIRDLWPESIVAVGAMRNRHVIRALEGLAGALYDRADLLVPVTDAFRRHLLEHGVPDDRILVVTNGIDASTVRVDGERQETRRRYGIPEHAFAVGYIGTVGMAHGVDTLVDAARSAAGDASIHFVAMGEGADKARVRELADRHGLSNLTLLDGAPRQEAFRVLDALDTSLVMLIDTPLFETVIPSKIFESMALGKPIVLGVRGESRRIVIDECRAGIAFPPGNAAALLAAVRRLQSDPALYGELARNGRIAVERSYGRTTLAARMLAGIEAMLARDDRWFSR